MDLFDTLKEKPKTTVVQNDDLLSLDFSGFGGTPAATAPQQQVSFGNLVLIYVWSVFIRYSVQIVMWAVNLRGVEPRQNIGNVMITSSLAAAPDDRCFFGLGKHTILGISFLSS